MYPSCPAEAFFPLNCLAEVVWVGVQPTPGQKTCATKLHVSTAVKAGWKKVLDLIKHMEPSVFCSVLK